MRRQSESRARLKTFSHAGVEIEGLAPLNRVTKQASLSTLRFEFRYSNCTFVIIPHFSDVRILMYEAYDIIARILIDIRGRDW